MEQGYGELAQVYRTGEAFEHAAPTPLHESIVNGEKESDAMKRTTYMEQMTEHRKAKMSPEQHQHSAVFGALQQVARNTCQKLLDDPLWPVVEKKKA